jgi:hypothetical protein
LLAKSAAQDLVSVCRNSLRRIIEQETLMSGDAANSNDDELLSQIDELKARMDRLMRGGTSTSNSALLTDPPKSAGSPVDEAKPVPTPPPPRSRVRDLIGPDDSPSAPQTPEPRNAVPFPEERAADESRPADKPAEDRPPSGPPSKPKPAVGGSLISVDHEREEPRPRVSSFDDLGTAIESELARDASVPPASERKGPDLASRFGAAGEDVVEEVENEVIEEADDEVEVDPEPRQQQPVVLAEPREFGRRPVSALVAIWVFTAVTSGTLAALHFSGII